MSLLICAIYTPQISFAEDEANDYIDPSEQSLEQTVEQTTEETESQTLAPIEVETGTITGFVPLENDQYYFEGQPSEEEISVNLPSELSVYLNGSDEITQIPVTWEAVEDFDHTDFYFYSMKPVWDDRYTLSGQLDSTVDVPWITIYREDETNDDVEEMIEQNDMEPAYEENDSIRDIARDIIDYFTDSSYASTSNTTKVYNYLTTKMGLNKAAACGVMTNIYAESGMSSNNLENTYNYIFGLSDSQYTSRVDAGKGSYKTASGSKRNFKTDYCGYGLCQWTSLSRRANLLSKALKAGTSVSNISTQLAFLNTELDSYPSVKYTLQHVPNNASGAYTAAYIFCLAFEVPANTVSTATSRAKTCLSGYWKTYNGSYSTPTSSLSLCGYTYPKTIVKGKGMSVYGYVISNKTVKYYTGKILKSNGTTLYSKTIYPSSRSSSLSKIDSYMKFSKLSTGTYKYKITAKDSSGKSKTVTRTFTVVSSGSSSTSRGFASVAGTSSSTSSSTTTTTTTTSSTTAASASTTAASTLKITSYRYPTSLKKGAAFSIWGKVSSNYYLKKVTVGVYTTSGTAKQSAYRTLTSKNVKSYNVSNLDSKIKFGSLAKGTYYYKVMASDTKVSKVLLKKKFTVK